jgi:hypothetical protein
VSELLPQAGGFKGLGSVVVHLHSRYKAIPKRPDLRETHLHLWAAVPSFRMLADECNPLIPGVDRVASSTPTHFLRFRPPALENVVVSHTKSGGLSHARALRSLRRARSHAGADRDCPATSPAQYLASDYPPPPPRLPRAVALS